MASADRPELEGGRVALGRLGTQTWRFHLSARAKPRSVSRPAACVRTPAASYRNPRLRYAMSREYGCSSGLVICSASARGQGLGGQLSRSASISAKRARTITAGNPMRSSSRPPAPTERPQALYRRSPRSSVVARRSAGHAQVEARCHRQTKVASASPIARAVRPNIRASVSRSSASDSERDTSTRSRAVVDHPRFWRRSFWCRGDARTRCSPAHCAGRTRRSIRRSISSSSLTRVSGRCRVIANACSRQAAASRYAERAVASTPAARR